MVEEGMWGYEDDSYISESASINENESEEEASGKEVSDKDCFVFQEPDISIADGHKFVSKKVFGFPSRNKNLAKLEIFDIKQIAKSIQMVRDIYDEFLQEFGDRLTAANKVKERMKDQPIFQSLSFSPGVEYKEIGLFMYISDVMVDAQKGLMFDLKIEQKNDKGIKEKPDFLLNYFSNLSSFDKIRSTEEHIIIESLPCNVPLFTEYAKFFHYSFTQGLKFVVYSYGFDYEKNEKKVIKSLPLNKNKEELEMFLDTLVLYIRDEFPKVNVSKNGANNIISINAAEGQRIYLIKSKNDKSIEILFSGMPIELTEYYLFKINEIFDKIDGFISWKIKINTVIEAGKKDVADVFFGRNVDTSKANELIDKYIGYYETLQGKGGKLEADINLKFWKDLKINLKYSDLGIKSNNDYEKISEYYISILQSSIRKNNSLLNNRFSTDSERALYVKDILNFLDYIDNIIGREFVENLIQQVSRFSFYDINNQKQYFLVMETIFSWNTEKNREVNSTLLNLLKSIIKRYVFTSIFEYLKGSGDKENLEKELNKWEKYFEKLLPEKYYELLKTVLWGFAFEMCFYSILDHIDRKNFDFIDLSILELFVDKKIVPKNFKISDYRRHDGYYDISGKQYYMDIISYMDSYLKGEIKLNLESFSKEELLEKVVGMYYKDFCKSYESSRFEDYSFKDETIQEIYGYFDSNQKNSFDRLQHKIKIQLMLKEDKLRLKNNDQIDLSLYSSLFDQMNELKFTESGINRLKSEYKEFIESSLVSHIEKRKNAGKSYMTEENWLHFLDFIEEKEKEDYLEQLRKADIIFSITATYKEIEESNSEAINHKNVKIPKVIFGDSFHIRKQKNKMIAEMEEQKKLKEKQLLENDFSNMKLLTFQSYEGMDLDFAESLQLIEKLLKEKWKYDKRLISKVPDITLEKVLDSYSVFQSLYPDLVKEIRESLTVSFKEGDSVNELIYSFKLIDEAFENESINKELAIRMMNAMEKYMKGFHMDFENVSKDEKKVVKVFIKYILPFLFDGIGFKNVREISKFALKMSPNNYEKNLLSFVIEIADLQDCFEVDSYKYINVFLAILENVEIADHRNTSKTAISSAIFNHIINQMNVIEEKEKLSYEQMEYVVRKIKDSDSLNKSFKIAKIDNNTRFYMMLKHL